MNPFQADAHLRANTIGHWFPVPDVECAAALCTFGFKPRQKSQSIILRRDKEAISNWWIMSAKTSATGFKFAEVFKGWYDPRNSPEGHPVRAVRSYAYHIASLARARKRAPRISAEETIRRGAIKYLSGTTNTKLAGALMDAGFELDSSLPITQTEVHEFNQATYWFGVSDDDKRRLIGIVQNWERFAEFEAANPEHPMCFQRAYGENRERLLGGYQERNPLFHVQKGARHVLVTDGLPKSNKRELSKML